METLVTIGKTCLVLFSVYAIGNILISERNNYHFIWSVWRRFRIKMVFECLGIILLVVLAATALLQIPFLNFGWANLFYDGEGGNIFLKPVLEGSESRSVLIRSLIPLFFVAFILIVPFAAHSEEKSFRKGYNTWSKITKKSIEFGLIHCIVGIPIGAGIALIIPGFFFAFKYKQALERNPENFSFYWEKENEAVMVATTYHTLHNTFAGIVLFYIAFSAI